MYQKKFLFDKTHCYTGEPIIFLGAGKKTDKEPVRSAFKGKQPVTVFPKKIAAAQEGLFTKHTYASEAYDDTSGTLKEFPLDKRKAGFYSKAPARGMCAKTIDMERYRDHVRHEYHHLDAKLAESHAASASAADLEKVLSSTTSRIHTTFEKEGRDVQEGMPTTLYDFVHGDHKQDDWQKTNKDRWYHPKIRPSEERKRSGPYATASDDYGYGIDGIEEAPEAGKKSAWRDFLDKGHREANLSRF